jgi:acetoin utilization protein AcuC
MPNRASGFCYINDAAVAIKYLHALGKRVAYIDIDAHHGDGVEYAFYDSKDVLTISLHESGQWLFPGTGLVTDIGLSSARGFAVNMPLPPSTTDDIYLEVFYKIVPPFVEAFKPDIIVTQLGVDSFDTDPITHLSLTTNGFEEMVKAFRSFAIPWMALGGGGYDLSNVSRAWTLAWAIMNGVEAPEKVPKDLISINGEIFRNDSLRDEPIKPFILTKEDRETIDKDIEYLLKEVLPLVRKG